MFLPAPAQVIPAIKKHCPHPSDAARRPGTSETPRWRIPTGGSGSYWGGNNTAGGWAEVDANMALKGARLLPSAMKYNASYPDIGRRFGAWENASGALVRAWHPQSWALHMFQVSAHDSAAHLLSFDKGGSQGGRLWCRCDQCDYVCADEAVPPGNAFLTLTRATRSSRPASPLSQ